jgi:CO/xanthine dehydrogenase FAD-binding subunit
MFVRPFRYAAARSVEEAGALLREHGPEAKFLAGGQSLLPMVNLGLVQPQLLVDLSRIPGLDGVRGENGSLRLGALVRHRVLERSKEIGRAQPLLAAAVSRVGSPRVRNRGTLGGSLAHADPAAELPLTMVVLEAEIEASKGGESRAIPASDFALSYFATRLQEDEIVTSIRVPFLPDGWGWGFHEVSRRAGDFALVAAAAVARCREGVVESLRLGLAGVADRPVRCAAFERAAAAAALDGIDELADAVTEGLEPPDDASASGAYRARVARALGLRAVRDACARSMGAGA